MNALDNLIRLLKKLPGTGEKSAERLAYFLLKADSTYNASLSEAIGNIKEKIHPCPVCFAYSEGNECPFCNNPSRDKTLLCVVEEVEDVTSLSSTGAYNGLFHVLGGAIDPLNGIGPDNLRLKELKKRIEEGSFKEVIIATNPTEKGNTTALYIQEMLSPFNITISRLASGVPFGGDLGYVNKSTLSFSLKGRVTVSKDRRNE